jgi:hypothetical protein
MMKPRDAPEKRPSVISAVEPASPAPINAAVGPLYPKMTVTSTIKERGPRNQTQPSVAYLASNMCDAQNTARTGETTRGGGEVLLYLWHTGGTFGALVPKNEYHPRFDLARSERGVD